MRLMILALLLAGLFQTRGAEDRVQKVLQDSVTVKEAGYWIYNDLEQGFRRAKATGKPLLVVLRCIP